MDAMASSQAIRRNGDQFCACQQPVDGVLEGPLEHETIIPIGGGGWVCLSSAHMAPWAEERSLLNYFPVLYYSPFTQGKILR